MVTRAPAKTEAPAFAEVATTAIAQHPDNPRHDVGDVTDLAASIAEHGVLEPLIVIPESDVPDDVADRWVRRKSVLYALVAGHRRLAAAREAGAKTVPVIVRHDLATRDAQVAAMVIENQHRADLSPVEEGEAYQLLLDITPGATQAKVAKAVGMPRQRVSERLRLTKLTEATRDAVHARQLSITDALELAKLEEQVPELAARVAEHVGTRDFAVRLERAKGQVEDVRAVAKCREVAEAHGTTIGVYTPPDGRYLSTGMTIRGVEYERDEQTAGKAALIAAHASCPGAYLRIPTGTDRLWNVDIYCTAWDDNHAPTDEDRAAAAAAREAADEQHRAERLAAMTDEERAEHDAREAERAAAEQARRERDEILAAAAVVRHRHLAEVVARGDHGVAMWALTQLHLAEYRPEYSFTPSAEDLALVGVDHDPARTGDEATALFTEALEKLSIESSVILLYLADKWELFDFLRHGPTSYNTTEEHLEDVQVLSDYFGYEWSDAEREIFGLDEQGHVIVDTDDDAGADEDGDL